MEMTVELFDNIINTSQDCVFWKDKDRRFIGVNQAFLDFYGFDSADVLIGKNDEDMGWHSDPEPYKQDELDVLAGKSTYKVQGKCFVRGEERDIIASKRPLYENGEIVGLVGSFVDITDVLRRRENLEGLQTVYNIDKLRGFSFFDKIVDEISLDEILDPLTGILSRAYSVKFIRSLISARTSFTFSIVDLDNFKLINDSFGHSAGDRVLREISKGLADFVGNSGLVGRFGGDELLIIDLKNTGSEDKNAFFEKLYSDSGVFRKQMDFENGSSLVTATIGSASYPEDEDDYPGLFSLIDKMLYLGKNSGRNCYTVYDRQLHRGVEIINKSSRGAYTDMHRIRLDMEKADGFADRIKAVLPLMTEILQAEDIFFVGDDGRMRAVMDSRFDEDASDLDKLMEEDLYSENTMDHIASRSPVFFESLNKHGFKSALISRIRKRDHTAGYLICAVERSYRIWQENECAVLYYVANNLADL